MKKNLYVSDVDGTLLDNKGQLSENSRKKLNFMLDNGLYFTAASARSAASIKTVLPDLHIKLPIIGYNGGYISDYTSGKHHIVNNLNHEAAIEIISIGSKMNFTPFLSTYNGVKEQVFYEFLPNEGMKWVVEDKRIKNDTRMKNTKTLNDHFSHKLMCITFIDKMENLVSLKDAVLIKFGDILEPHFFHNDYSPGWWWLTLHDGKATKDQGIKSLRENFGLDDDFRLTVFGDHKNDIKMFKNADRAIAPSNAVEEVKECADEIIGSNEEDSVVEFIYREFMKS